MEINLLLVVSLCLLLPSLIYYKEEDFDTLYNCIMDSFERDNFKDWIDKLQKQIKNLEERNSQLLKYISIIEGHLGILDDVIAEKDIKIKKQAEWSRKLGQAMTELQRFKNDLTNKTIKTVYLASPYSHKSKTMMAKREKEITRVAAMLLNKHKVSFFLPITQSAPLARHNKKLKGDFETWKEIDLNEVALRDETWVVTMPGWYESIGVQSEIQYALQLGKPVKFVSPKTLQFIKSPIRVINK